MKKVLLSLVALAGAWGVASADTLCEFTCDTDKQESCNQYNVAWTSTAGNFSWTITNFSNNLNGWDNIRCGSKTVGPNVGMITTDKTIAGEVTEVVVDFAVVKATTESANNAPNSIYLQTATDAEFSDTKIVEKIECTEALPTAVTDNVLRTFTITKPASNLYYRLCVDMPKTKDNGAIGVNSIKFNGTPVDVTVAAPDMAYDKETGMVTMSCATEGAEIRYTTDAEAEVADWTVYEGPFAPAESCTLYAVAVKGEDVSARAQLVVVVPVVYKSVSDVIAAIAAGEIVPNGEVRLSAELTYVYTGVKETKSGALNYYNYVTDGTGYLLCFNTQVPEGWENGQKFAGLKATYSPYYNLPELTNITYGEAGEKGEAVEPAVVTADQLGESLYNSYLKMEGMTVDAATKTMTDKDGNDVVLYVQFGDVEIPTGINYTVTGFYGVYSEKQQFYPVAFEQGQVEEGVSAPVFTPAGGRISEATEVTIDTHGYWTVYAFDVEDPETADWHEYNEPFTVDRTCTIWAYSENDDFIRSEMTKVEFTFVEDEPVVPVAGTATFNFADFESMDPVIETPTETSTGTEIGGITYVADEASFMADEVAEGNGPKGWLGTKATSFRFYKGNTFTISVGDKFKLTSVELTGAAGNVALAEGEKGVYDSKTSTWTAGDEALQSVKFVGVQDKGGKDISAIVVKYDVNTGVESVTADQDAPVEYYNLQGVRVANPANGLYICRQGNSVTKVVL